jgi:Sec-independent protein translocase protein TatA
MGLGIAEILLILLIASLVFGWRNLLDLPQAVLKSMKELKRQSRSQ